MNRKMWQLYPKLGHEAAVRTIPSNVLVVGMGGLGCPVTWALALAGVRRMTLIDPDVVDESNLHRQLWHHQTDIGRPKVLSAAEKLMNLFPGIELDHRQVRLDASNAVSLFRQHAIVMDATDGVETKFLLSDTSVKTGTPLIYGGVVRFEGLAMRIERGGPCLRCLFETPPEDAVSCSSAGILGSMAGLVGGLQAELALGSGRGGTSTLHVIDGAELSFWIITVCKRATCEACRPKRIDITNELCPMTYVRVKLAMEALADGETLEVLLRGEEPLRNVPRSAQEDGHRVLSVSDAGGGAQLLTLEIHHFRTF
jgi:molybdopterin/thiamine biosynthesis adenylyltransferase